MAISRKAGGDSRENQDASLIRVNNVSLRLQVPQLLIAGASGRATAFSAVRSKLDVAIGDLFADRDASLICDATAISDWPRGIEAWVARYPASVPLMYVGGLENELDILSRLANRRPLWGTNGRPLETVRDPFRLKEFLAKNGFATARAVSSPPVGPGCWLVKRRLSAGGRHVRLWDDSTPVGPGEYQEEFIEGTPGSAAFISDGNGSAVLLGVTEMLLPDDAPLAVTSPFAYVGSITRTEDEFDAQALERLGTCLASLGLRGLFGVDFVRARAGADDEFVVLEINPRYTAGMEVLELHCGISFVGEHRRVFTGEFNASRVHRKQHAGHVGKRIVFAPCELVTGDFPMPTPEEIHAGSYEIADVPEKGARISAGSPICTVFASGASFDECRERLKQRERDVLSRCSS